MPARSNIRMWVIQNEGFAAQYERARLLGLENWADEIYDVSEGPKKGDCSTQVQRDRLKVDARTIDRWKLKPSQKADAITLLTA